MDLFTIGHSNHTFNDFLEILKAHGISQVLDIRAIPRSSYVPWFNKSNLAKVLPKQNIGYKHLPELGGWRKPLKDSINLGWKNSAFRGFADYMQTKSFYIALKALNQLIQKHPKTVIMCAEAVPWRCHRSLIADAQIIRRIHVHHIMNKSSTREHTLTSFAVVDKTTRPYRLYYPKYGE